MRPGTGLSACALDRSEQQMVGGNPVKLLGARETQR
jgi:hypothetical protein